MIPADYIYDIESYPNVFTFSAKLRGTDMRWKFEISGRCNDLHKLVAFIYSLKDTKGRMIGYNNLHYDYPVIHWIINNSLNGITGYDIYQKSMSIIESKDRFGHMIWDNDRIVEQLDLFKIHHFDNMARSTSLKMLEFNMRSPNIEDLPFPVGTVLTSDEIDELIIYNDHDVDETEKFLEHSDKAIKFREKMSTKYGRNFMNHNDKKIGTDIFIKELEDAGVLCYEKDPITGRRKPRQSRRQTIHMGDVILPSIKFQHPSLIRVLNWMMVQTLVATELKPDVVSTKGVFKGVNATIDGFTMDFGLGGIHGSVASTIVESDDEWVIIDKDVKGYYPWLFIVNRFFPEHLGETFCDIFTLIGEQRDTYDKGTDENTGLKLASNGSFGDTGNEYAVFLDKLCMMRVTINGQLQLATVIEQLVNIPNLQMIQANTDGFTIRVKRDMVDNVEAICDMWQASTGLELEEDRYSRMFIRDVNNYIGEYEGTGKLKRKGAYGYLTKLDDPNSREVEWHKNHSALVIPKAAEAALVHGRDIRDFITKHQDIHDFMLRTKAPRAAHLILTTPQGERQLQNITRYYISTDGGSLTKISPPAKGHHVGEYKRKSGITDEYYEQIKAVGYGHWDERIHTKNKSKYTERRDAVSKGWLVTPCNDITHASRHNINFDYYITEAEKLVKPLWN
jgi:hypothetical protein